MGILYLGNLCPIFDKLSCFLFHYQFPTYLLILIRAGVRTQPVLDSDIIFLPSYAFINLPSFSRDILKLQLSYFEYSLYGKPPNLLCVSGVEWTCILQGKGNWVIGSKKVLEGGGRKKKGDW